MPLKTTVFCRNRGEVEVKLCDHCRSQEHVETAGVWDARPHAAGDLWFCSLACLHDHGNGIAPPKRNVIKKTRADVEDPRPRVLAEPVHVHVDETLLFPVTVQPSASRRSWADIVEGF